MDFYLFIYFFMGGFIGFNFFFFLGEDYRILIECGNSYSFI